MQQPVGHLVEQPVGHLVELPVGHLVEQPVGHLVEQPVGHLVEQPVQQPVGHLAIQVKTNLPQISVQLWFLLVSVCHCYLYNIFGGALMCNGHTVTS